MAVDPTSPEFLEKLAVGVAAGGSLAASVWTRWAAWREKKADADKGQDAELLALRGRVEQLEAAQAIAAENVRRDEWIALLEQQKRHHGQIAASQRRILARLTPPKGGP